MSLRDGVHRRAPLTARFGSARFGAARFGCAYGQDDLAELTREIKNAALVALGPFYVWAERYPTDAPFSGLVGHDLFTGLARLLMRGNSTSLLGATARLLLTGDSTSKFYSLGTTANLLLAGGDQMVFSTASLKLAGDSDSELVPGP